MDGKEGKEKIQLVGDTPGQPLPQAQVGVQLPLPSPTESLDRKHRPRSPGGNLEGALEEWETGTREWEGDRQLPTG